jgi:hypothetical protein
VISLASTSDLLQIVTTGTAPIDVLASWIDVTSASETPDETDTLISSATTTTVVSSPAASTVRIVKSLHLRNRDATNPNTVTVQHTDGATAVELEKVTLAAGESLSCVEGQGFRLVTALGAEA